MIATASILRFIPRGAPQVGPVAQWSEPAAHNGLVAGSSPARPTTHALDRAHFPESVISADFARSYSTAAWNFGLNAGQFWRGGRESAPGLTGRFFSFRSGRRRRPKRPNFETPETGSKRRRRAARRKREEESRANNRLSYSDYRAPARSRIGLRRGPDGSGGFR
jgi:hypothetical protein